MVGLGEQGILLFFICFENLDLLDLRPIARLGGGAFESKLPLPDL